MKPDEKLLAMGGQPVGGTIFLNHEPMGSYGVDGFELTEAGEAAVADAKPARAPAPARKRAPDPTPTLNPATKPDEKTDGASNE